MLDINNFLGIGIVGATLSVALQYIKAKMGTNSKGSKLLTIGLSLFVGGIYVVFQDTVWWETAIGVLSAATIVYSYVPLPDFKKSK